MNAALAAEATEVNMTAVLAGLVYIIPMLAAFFLPYDLILLRLILLYPAVELAVCAVHELSHAVLFRLGKARIKAVRIGAFNFDLTSKRLTVHIRGMFSGNCTVSIASDSNRNRIIAAIVSGGCSGIIIAAILLLIKILTGVNSSVVLCCIVTSFTKGAYALLSPRSTDRALLEEWVKK